MEEKRMENSGKNSGNKRMFFTLLILGVVAIISAIINMLIYLEDTVVLVSKPFIALGIALIIIAFFYKPRDVFPK